MNNRITIRSQAAALMLLVPLAGAFMALPAAAQQRGVVVAQNSLIERFVMRPMGRLRPGEEVRFRVDGAPRASAWVDIPGVVSGLPLQEVRPGVYEGSHVVRRTDDTNAFERSVATLQSSWQRSSARVELPGQGRDRDARSPRRDDIAPQITDMSPAHGARVSDRGRTLISARLSDDGRGVDPASVQLRVNGRDVTRAARVTDTSVQYQVDLPPGRHTAELTVRDLAGNTARRSWSFDVVDRDRDRRDPPVAIPPQVVPLQITSHASGTRVDFDRPIMLSGRATPAAVVQVDVRGIFGGQLQDVVSRSTRADINGNFSMGLVPPAGNPSEYQIRVTVPGPVPMEQVLVLRRR